MLKGIIYKATSKHNSKVYIGQTTNSLRQRKNEHKYYSLFKNTKFYYHIRKYGRDDLIWEILEKNIPVNKLDVKEIKYIEKYDSFRRGLNSIPGGVVCRGFKQSKKTINKRVEKISKNYLITKPDGTKEYIKNLAKYCRRHRLTIQLMRRVEQGVRKHHKGYKCKKI